MGFDLNQDFLRLLGLALRAGKAALGEEGVGEAAAAGKARLVLLASDAAENSVRRAHRFTEGGHAVVLQVPFTKAELGSAFGRGSCAMAAITESGLALAAAKKLSLLADGKYNEAVKTLAAKDERIRARRGTRKRPRKT